MSSLQESHMNNTEVGVSELLASEAHNTITTYTFSHAADESRGKGHAAVVREVAPDFLHAYAPGLVDGTTLGATPDQWCAVRYATSQDLPEGASEPTNRHSSFALVIATPVDGGLSVETRWYGLDPDADPEYDPAEGGSPRVSRYVSDVKNLPAGLVMEEVMQQATVDLDRWRSLEEVDLTTGLVDPGDAAGIIRLTRALSNDAPGAH